MTFEQTAIISIISMVMLMLTWGKYRYDIVAILALILAVITGVIPANEAFLGFGHPATITIAIVLIISTALSQLGATEKFSELIKPFTSRPTSHIGILSFFAGSLSMFMNNVGALALLMPVAIDSAIKAKRSPSSLLMPISFSSILGGMITLIGTPPNIIIASYRQKTFGEAFKLFDFAYVGAIVAIIGIIFITFIGRHLVKIRKSATDDESFNIESYITEVTILSTSLIRGKTIKEVEALIGNIDITIISLIKKNQKFTVIPRTVKFLTNDILIVEGSQEDIDKFITTLKLKIHAVGGLNHKILESNDAEIIEVVVKPNSHIISQTVEQIYFKRRYGINLLAISRNDKAYRSRLKSLTIRSGDVLLIHGDKDEINDSISKLECFPLEKRNINFGKRKFAPYSLAMFAGAVLLAGLGILPIYIALAAVILLMVFSNIISEKDIYLGIDFPVIALLGAMIPIGQAFETTGASQLLVDLIMVHAGSLDSIYILTIILITTMTLSDILNNAATAILMTPIAISIAATIGANPDSFMMAVAIGASCAFLTPIGHQNNTLIMTAGGYRFSDYWRLGLPLEIIIIITSVPAINYFWPL